MSSAGTVTVADQRPGQAVIEALLRQHSSTPPRSKLARFFGLSPLSGDSASWYEGACGEIAVGRILETLPTGWRSFHALPIGKNGADIDHLVVGPGGVFTINTKHHRDKAVWVAGSTLLVSGQKQPHIRNSEFEAGRVTKLLRERMSQLPPVQPVLALVNPKSLRIKTKPRQVAVLNANRLRGWLTRRPELLHEADVRELIAVVDDPATWSAVPLSTMGDRDERFAALDSEVRSARVLRKVWALAGLLAFISVAFLVGPSLVAMLLRAYWSAVVQP